MDRERVGVIFDRSYGKIEYSSEELRLFQTKEISRLRQISLTTTPPWMVRAGNCATRFEHSLGVAELSKLSGANSGFNDLGRDLYFASLAHDIGSPPFSHLSEGIMEKILGINHEEHAIRILDDSEYAFEVRKQGGNLDVIKALIMGDLKPFSDVLNGSLDVDNLDNVLRYGLSLGLISDRSYSPENIAAAFTIHNGVATLSDSCLQDLDAWVETRRVVYDYVYGAENGSPGSMVHRAVDLAYRDGKLAASFFGLTDIEACTYLKTLCGEAAAKLVDRAEQWVFYEPVINVRTTKPSERLVEISDNEDYRGSIADDLAREFKMPPEDVCVYLKRGKGYRKVHLPILGKDGKLSEYESSGLPVWMAQVYLYPEHLEKAEKIVEAARIKLGI